MSERDNVDRASLSDTLAWMDNSYNSHPGVSGADGHGRTGPPIGGIETFTYNGCQMTLHFDFEEDSAWNANRQMVNSRANNFNLRDINPQSISMGTVHGDRAEIAFKTRLEAPLIDVYSHSIYPNLKGSEHESEIRSKANEGHFSVDDVEYAKRLMKAFRHAVELCGGKPEPF